MDGKKDCLFCKFAKGEIKPKTVFEDENYLAFLDINPMHPGHTLLIPKEHIDYIFDLDDKEYTNYFLKAKKLSQVLKKALGTEKVGMVIEGFCVRHAHIHLIPINNGMPLDPCLQKPADEKELEEISEKIRKEL
jgi:histidine triad (HIT) family protein